VIRQMDPSVHLTYAARANIHVNRRLQRKQAGFPRPKPLSPHKNSLGCVQSYRSDQLDVRTSRSDCTHLRLIDKLPVTDDMRRSAV